MMNSRMRALLTCTWAILVAFLVTGCQTGEASQPQGAAYECTDAGRRAADALAVALGAPTATTKAFDDCGTQWKTAGVRMDPFLANGTMRAAEKAAQRQFGCGTASHPPNMSPREAASLECTIDGARAHVFLLQEGDRVSANIYPRP